MNLKGDAMKAMTASDVIQMGAPAMQLFRFILSVPLMKRFEVSHTNLPIMKSRPGI
jgi:hypothetical protein